MKPIATHIATIIGAVGLCGLSLGAAELGMPAPALQVAEWVKGGPVDLAAGKGKTVFVVEFWATWCPPCRTSIPHLTGLQKKFKDQGVLFIGVTDEESAVVKKFVKQMGDKMDYTVAIDKDRQTAAGYMKAFDVGGIPHAFVVDKQGRIVWQGHPMDALEETVQKVLDGTYSMADAKKRADAQKKLEEFYELAGNGVDEARMNQLGKELETADKELGGLLPGRKLDLAEIKRQAQFGGAMRAYQSALLEGQDADKLEKLAKQAEALAPPQVKFAELEREVRSQAVFQRYLRAASEGADDAKLAPLAKAADEVQTRNVRVLNEVAWRILTDENIKKRDVALATSLAKKAYEGSEPKMAAIADTYARALFDSGKIDEAVAQQKKAIELCDNDQQRPGLEATLKRYQEKAPAK